MNKKRVAILISGGGSNMMSLVRDMQNADHPAEPVLVLSNKPDAGGLAKAADLGIETAVVESRVFKNDRQAFETALSARLAAVRPDIICLAGFMRILSADFTTQWAGKILNIHPSLLPSFKGLHTHQRALDAGVAVHGCSVHEVNAELDGGKILGQAVIPVLPDDTADSLAARVLKMEHQLYPVSLRKFASGDTSKTSLLWSET